MRVQYIFLAFVTFLIGLFAYWFFFGAATTVRNYPSSGTDIVAFGDSLVAGVGATEGHDFVSLLSQRLGQPIVNLGKSGDTTEGGLARLTLLDAYHPKVVILLLGGNDYLRRVPQEQTFENLAQLIKDIEGRGSTVLLLGIRGGLLNDHFDSRFEDLHEEYETAYVSNVLHGLLGNKEYMSDEIHPNDAGYARIAERIYPVLASLLK